MTGHPAECLCVECAPLPDRIDPMMMTSPEYRRERGRQWARALKLPEDAWDEVGERYDAGWRREHARQIEEARELEERVARWGGPDGSRYGEAALARMLNGLGQHDTPSEEIERVAYECGRLIAGGELSDAVVHRSLAQAMDALCLPEDVFTPVVERALTRGAARPRSAPMRLAA